MTFVEGNASPSLFTPFVSVVPDDTRPNFTRVAKSGRQGYLPPKDSNIKKGYFTSHGMRISYYTAEAPDEKMMIMGCSGFKSDYIFHPNEIAELNRQGISVLWIALPNPGRNTDFMPYFNQAAEDTIITPPKNRIQEWCNRDVPKIFFGHSTGGQIFFHLMRERRAFAKLNTLFSGAVLSSPYIRCANAASPLNPFKHTFDWYSAKNASLLPSETRLGALYLKFYGNDGTHSPDMKYQHPTYGQIQELLHHGQSVMDDIVDPQANILKRKFPIMIFAGENDGFSCPTTSRKVAAYTDAAFYIAKKAGHAPISENPVTLQWMIAACRHMADGTFNEFSDLNNLENYWSKARKAAMPLIPDQPQAASLPLASPTSALHAT